MRMWFGVGGRPEGESISQINNPRMRRKISISPLTRILVAFISIFTLLFDYPLYVVGIHLNYVKSLREYIYQSIKAQLGNVAISESKNVPWGESGGSTGTLSTESEFQSGKISEQKEIENRDDTETDVPDEFSTSENLLLGTAYAGGFRRPKQPMCKRYIRQSKEIFRPFEVLSLPLSWESVEKNAVDIRELFYSDIRWWQEPIKIHRLTLKIEGSKTNYGTVKGDFIISVDLDGDTKNDMVAIQKFPYSATLVVSLSSDNFSGEFVVDFLPQSFAFAPVGRRGNCLILVPGDKSKYYLLCGRDSFELQEDTLNYMYLTDYDDDGVGEFIQIHSNSMDLEKGIELNVVLIDLNSFPEKSVCQFNNVLGISVDKSGHLFLKKLENGLKYYSVEPKGCTMQEITSTEFYAVEDITLKEASLENIDTSKIAMCRVYTGSSTDFPVFSYNWEYFQSSAKSGVVENCDLSSGEISILRVKDRIKFPDLFYVGNGSEDKFPFCSRGLGFNECVSRANFNPAQLNKIKDEFRDVFLPCFLKIDEAAIYYKGCDPRVMSCDDAFDKLYKSYRCLDYMQSAYVVEKNGGGEDGKNKIYGMSSPWIYSDFRWEGLYFSGEGKKRGILCTFDSNVGNSQCGLFYGGSRGNSLPVFYSGSPTDAKSSILGKVLLDNGFTPEDDFRYVNENKYILYILPAGIKHTTGVYGDTIDLYLTLSIDVPDYKSRDKIFDCDENFAGSSTWVYELEQAIALLKSPNCIDFGDIPTSGLEQNAVIDYNCDKSGVDGGTISIEMGEINSTHACACKTFFPDFLHCLRPDIYCGSVFPDKTAKQEKEIEVGGFKMTVDSYSACVTEVISTCMVGADIGSIWVDEFVKDLCEGGSLSECIMSNFIGILGKMKYNILASGIRGLYKKLKEVKEKLDKVEYGLRKYIAFVKRGSFLNVGGITMDYDLGGLDNLDTYLSEITNLTYDKFTNMTPWASQFGALIWGSKGDDTGIAGMIFSSALQVSKIVVDILELPSLDEEEKELKKKIKNNEHFKNNSTSVALSLYQYITDDIRKLKNDIAGGIRVPECSFGLPLPLVELGYPLPHSPGGLQAFSQISKGVFKAKYSLSEKGFPLKGVYPIPVMAVYENSNVPSYFLVFHYNVDENGNVDRGKMTLRKIPYDLIVELVTGIVEGYAENSDEAIIRIPLQGEFLKRFGEKISGNTLSLLGDNEKGASLDFIIIKGQSSEGENNVVIGGRKKRMVKGGGEGKNSELEDIYFVCKLGGDVVLGDAGEDTRCKEMTIPYGIADFELRFGISSPEGDSIPSGKITPIYEDTKRQVLFMGFNPYRKYFRLVYKDKGSGKLRVLIGKTEDVINSVGFGDLNSDGESEIFALSKDKISVFGFPKGGGFVVGASPSLSLYADIDPLKLRVGDEIYLVGVSGGAGDTIFISDFYNLEPKNYIKFGSRVVGLGFIPAEEFPSENEPILIVDTEDGFSYMIKSFISAPQTVLSYVSNFGIIPQKSGGKINSILGMNECPSAEGGNSENDGGSEENSSLCLFCYNYSSGSTYYVSVPLIGVISGFSKDKINQKDIINVSFAFSLTSEGIYNLHSFVSMDFCNGASTFVSYPFDKIFRFKNFVVGVLSGPVNTGDGVLVTVYDGSSLEPITGFIVPVTSLQDINLSDFNEDGNRELVFREVGGECWAFNITSEVYSVKFLCDYTPEFFPDVGTGGTLIFVGSRSGAGEEIGFRKVGDILILASSDLKRKFFINIGDYITGYAVEKKAEGNFVLTVNTLGGMTKEFNLDSSGRLKIPAGKQIFSDVDLDGKNERVVYSGTVVSLFDYDEGEKEKLDWGFDIGDQIKTVSIVDGEKSKFIKVITSLGKTYIFSEDGELISFSQNTLGKEGIYLDFDGDKFPEAIFIREGSLVLGKVEGDGEISVESIWTPDRKNHSVYVQQGENITPVVRNEELSPKILRIGKVKVSGKYYILAEVGYSSAYCDFSNPRTLYILGYRRSETGKGKLYPLYHTGALRYRMSNDKIYIIRLNEGGGKKRKLVDKVVKTLYEGEATYSVVFYSGEVEVVELALNGLKERKLTSFEVQKPVNYVEFEYIGGVNEIVATISLSPKLDDCSNLLGEKFFPGDVECPENRSSRDVRSTYSYEKSSLYYCMQCASKKLGSSLNDISFDICSRGKEKYETDTRSREPEECKKCSGIGSILIPGADFASLGARLFTTGLAFIVSLPFCIFDSKKLADLAALPGRMIKGIFDGLGNIFNFGRGGKRGRGGGGKSINRKVICEKTYQRCITDQMDTFADVCLDFAGGSIQDTEIGSYCRSLTETMKFAGYLPVAFCIGVGGKFSTGELTTESDCKNYVNENTQVLYGFCDMVKDYCEEGWKLPQVKFEELADKALRCQNIVFSSVSTAPASGETADYSGSSTYFDFIKDFLISGGVLYGADPCFWEFVASYMNYGLNIGKYTSLVVKQSSFTGLSEAHNIAYATLSFTSNIAMGVPVVSVSKYGVSALDKTARVSYDIIEYTIEEIESYEEALPDEVIAEPPKVSSRFSEGFVISKEMESKISEFMFSEELPADFSEIISSINLSIISDEIEIEGEKIPSTIQCKDYIHTIVQGNDSSSEEESKTITYSFECYYDFPASGPAFECLFDNAGMFYVSPFKIKGWEEMKAGNFIWFFNDLPYPIVTWTPVGDFSGGDGVSGQIPKSLWLKSPDGKKVEVYDDLNGLKINEIWEKARVSTYSSLAPSIGLAPQVGEGEEEKKEEKLPPVPTILLSYPKFEDEDGHAIFQDISCPMLIRALLKIEKQNGETLYKFITLAKLVDGKINCDDTYCYIPVVGQSDILSRIKVEGGRVYIDAQDKPYKSVDVVMFILRLNNRIPECSHLKARYRLSPKSLELVEVDGGKIGIKFSFFDERGNESKGYVLDYKEPYILSVDEGGIVKDYFQDDADRDCLEDDVERHIASAHLPYFAFDSLEPEDPLYDIQVDVMRAYKVIKKDDPLSSFSSDVRIPVYAIKYILDFRSNYSKIGRGGISLGDQTGFLLPLRAEAFKKAFDHMGIGGKKQLYLFTTYGKIVSAAAYQLDLESEFPFRNPDYGVMFGKPILYDFNRPQKPVIYVSAGEHSLYLYPSAPAGEVICPFLVSYIEGAENIFLAGRAREIYEDLSAEDRTCHACGTSGLFGINMKDEIRYAISAALVSGGAPILGLLTAIKISDCKDKVVTGADFLRRFGECVNEEEDPYCLVRDSLEEAYDEAVKSGYSVVPPEKLFDLFEEYIKMKGISRYGIEKIDGKNKKIYMKDGKVIDMDYDYYNYYLSPQTQYIVVPKGDRDIIFNRSLFQLFMGTLFRKPNETSTSIKSVLDSVLKIAELNGTELENISFAGYSVCGGNTSSCISTTSEGLFTITIPGANGSPSSLIKFQDIIDYVCTTPDGQKVEELCKKYKELFSTLSKLLYTGTQIYSECESMNLPAEKCLQAMLYVELAKLLSKLLVSAMAAEFSYDPQNSSIDRQKLEKFGDFMSIDEFDQNFNVILQDTLKNGNDLSFQNFINIFLEKVWEILMKIAIKKSLSELGIGENEELRSPKSRCSSFEQEIFNKLNEFRSFLRASLQTLLGAIVENLQLRNGTASFPEIVPFYMDPVFQCFRPIVQEKKTGKRVERECVLNSENVEQCLSDEFNEIKDFVMNIVNGNISSIENILIEYIYGKYIADIRCDFPQDCITDFSSQIDSLIKTSFAENLARIVSDGSSSSLKNDLLSCGSETFLQFIREDRQGGDIYHLFDKNKIIACLKNELDISGRLKHNLNFNATIGNMLFYMLGLRSNISAGSMLNLPSSSKFQAVLNTSLNLAGVDNSAKDEILKGLSSFMGIAGFLYQVYAGGDKSDLFKLLTELVVRAVSFDERNGTPPDPEKLSRVVKALDAVGLGGPIKELFSLFVKIGQLKLDIRNLTGNSEIAEEIITNLLKEKTVYCFATAMFKEFEPVDENGEILQGENFWRKEIGGQFKGIQSCISGAVAGLIASAMKGYAKKMGESCESLSQNISQGVCDIGGGEGDLSVELQNCACNAFSEGAKLVCQCTVESASGTALSTIEYAMVGKVKVEPSDVLDNFGSSFGQCVDSKKGEFLLSSLDACQGVAGTLGDKLCAEAELNGDICRDAAYMLYDAGMCLVGDAVENVDATSCLVDKIPKMLPRLMKIAINLCLSDEECSDFIGNLGAALEGAVEELIGDVGDLAEYIGTGIQLGFTIAPVIAGAVGCFNNENAAEREKCLGAVFSDPYNIFKMAQFSIKLAEALGFNISEKLGLGANMTVNINGLSIPIMDVVLFIIRVINAIYSLQECLERGGFEGYCYSLFSINIMAATSGLIIGILAATGAISAGTALAGGIIIAFVILILQVAIVLAYQDIAEQIEEEIETCVSEFKDDIDNQLISEFTRIYNNITNKKFQSMKNFLSVAQDYGANINEDELWQAFAALYVLDKMFPAAIRPIADLDSYFKVKLLVSDYIFTVFYAVYEGYKFKPSSLAYSVNPVYICLNSYHDGESKMNKAINDKVKKLLRIK